MWNTVWNRRGGHSGHVLVTDRPQTINHLISLRIWDLTWFLMMIYDLDLFFLDSLSHVQDGLAICLTSTLQDWGHMAWGICIEGLTATAQKYSALAVALALCVEKHGSLQNKDSVEWPSSIIL